MSGGLSVGRLTRALKHSHVRQWLTPRAVGAAIVAPTMKALVFISGAAQSLSGETWAHVTALVAGGLFAGLASGRYRDAPVSAVSVAVIYFVLGALTNSWLATTMPGLAQELLQFGFVVGILSALFVAPAHLIGALLLRLARRLPPSSSLGAR